MQDYPKESGRGCFFFAGLLFALVLGGGGYWMLHKGTLTVGKTAPRKPDIAELDARAKPHFDRAKQNIPAVVEELTSYSSMVKFCYLASCDKLSGGNRAQEYLASVINARIIDPCREGAKVYGCDVNPASFQKHIAELNSDAAVASAYAASGMMLEAVFMKSTIKAFTSGLRNSHDKSFAVGLSAGISVTVCSNLAFGGTAVIKRRHTSRIELTELVDVAMTELENEFLILETVCEDLKIIYLKNDDEARSRIVRAAELGAINSSDIVPVFREFKNPRHPEFSDPTRYSLLNAFTETIKKYTPGRVDASYRQLTSCFGLDGHRPALWS